MLHVACRTATGYVKLTCPRAPTPTKEAQTSIDYISRHQPMKHLSSCPMNPEVLVFEAAQMHSLLLFISGGPLIPQVSLLQGALAPGCDANSWISGISHGPAATYFFGSACWPSPQPGSAKERGLCKTPGLWRWADALVALDRPHRLDFWRISNCRCCILIQYDYE